MKFQMRNEDGLAGIRRKATKLLARLSYLVCKQCATKECEEDYAVSCEIHEKINELLELLE